MGKKAKAGNQNTLLMLSLILFASVLLLVFTLNNRYTNQTTLTQAAKPVEVSSIKLNESNPKLGTEVTFTITYPKRVKTPLIQISCSQNGTVVYVQAGRADPTDSRYMKFVLGGGWSLWLSDPERSVNPATCVATLYYWDYAPKQVYHYLADTTFTAAGKP